MPNTSATGGYLSPVSLATPIEDAALDAAIQRMVAGITGLDGSLVRPRWQPVTPKQPEPNITWCAIGITNRTPDDNAAVLHDPNGDGQDHLIRHEGIELLASFYGLQGQTYAGILRDGMQIEQNREALRSDGMAFVSAGQMLAVPELYNQQWIRRYDLTIYLRRVINRTYPVLNIIEADPQFTADVPDLQFISNN